MVLVAKPFHGETQREFEPEYSEFKKKKSCEDHQGAWARNVFKEGGSGQPPAGQWYLSTDQAEQNKAQLFLGLKLPGVHRHYRKYLNDWTKFP